MLEPVLSGEIRLPAGDVPTPFVEAEDIADIAAAALTDDRLCAAHRGQRRLERCLSGRRLSGRVRFPVPRNAG